MTHCDFSARAARDEMRHIICSSEPDVIIGSDKDRTEGAERITWNFCANCVWRMSRAARYFVHEPTSEVNSRMKCVTKIMAMPETRTAVADLCMFGLAASDEGGPGFVNVRVRTITNARRVGCGCKANARVRTDTLGVTRAS